MVDVLTICNVYSPTLMFAQRGKGNRQQFPDGVVAAVRNLYPDPDEQYTGFRDVNANG